MNEKAFTLIEILVVTAITMIVTGLSVAGYRHFNKKQILQSTTAELKNNLSLARGWAMAPRKKYCKEIGSLSGYKVKIMNSSYEIYEVCDIATSPSPIRTFYFPEAIDDVANEIVLFQVLSGAVSNEVTITLGLDNMSEEIIIKTNGQIE